MEFIDATLIDPVQVKMALTQGKVVRVHDVPTLQAVARHLGVRNDWHEPDEQGVTAVVKGNTLDNAGFWPARRALGDAVEKHVEIRKHGQPVAVVNLATLFSFACQTHESAAPIYSGPTEFDAGAVC